MSAKQRERYYAARRIKDYDQRMAALDAALADLPPIPDDFFDDPSPPRRPSSGSSSSGAEAPTRKAERHQPPPTPKPKPFAPTPGAAGARTWKNRPQAAADSVQGKPFFDDGTGLGPSPPKGFRGNVSPASPNTFGEKDSRQQREALREARSASTNKTVVRQSLLDFNGVALGLGTSVEDCVERPTGDYRGPGKWRGAWFNWCKD